VISSAYKTKHLADNGRKVGLNFSQFRKHSLNDNQTFFTLTLKENIWLSIH